MKKFIIGFLFLLQGLLAQSQSVGIGTNTPNSSSLLDLTSTSKGFLAPRMTTAQRNAIVSPTTGLMVFDTTTGGYWFHNGSSWVSLAAGGTSAWLTNGTNVYYNDGNVGIGTSAPTEKLYISNGQIRLNRSAAFDNSILFNMPAATIAGEHQGLKFSLAGVDKAFVGYTSTGSLGGAGSYLRLSGADVNANDLIINNIGNVGLGTNTPTQKLDVVGSVKVSDGVDAGGLVKGANLNSGGTLIVVGNSLLGGDLVVQGDVQSNAGFTLNQANGTLQLSDGGAKKGYFQLSGDNVRFGTNSGNAAGNMIMRMNGTDRAVLTSAGNLGLGNLNPPSRLTVSGNTSLNNGNNEALGIDGTNPYLQFYQSGVARSYIQQTGTTLKLGVNGGKLNLQANQIAIGGVLTTADAYMLSVTGKIIGEEVKVKLSGSWPDYVFHSKYELMPLNELHQFIQLNNHLPNIPKAEELEANGIDLGEMQRKMMEKIEELTLYIIDLQKQVEELKKNK